MKSEDLRSAIVAELTAIAPDLDAGAITDDAHFIDDLGIDSMDYLNLISALQKRLGVSIPESDFPRLISVSAVIRYLSAKTG